MVIPEQLTIVSCVDAEHLHELKITAPVAIRHREELRRCRWIVVYDDSQASDEWWRAAILESIPHATPVPLSRCLPEQVARQHQIGTMLQREAMLSAFVYVVLQIETPWFAKLDADAISLERGPFLKREWFAGDPVFASSPWGYTVPSNALDTLDNWGDTVPGIREHKRLSIPFDPASRLVRSKRIISWLYFGRTDWHQWLAKLCRKYGPEGGRLPVASHDTLAWWCAERTGAFYRRVNMKKEGWAHVNGLRKLKEIARRVG